mmetsp:Transcript_7559/g.11384  ORF Transcript_7559/g.11384 Transcript_7559/m.11384 type:complete len:109 (-) Transcript_7559:334-660(-)
MVTKDNIVVLFQHDEAVGRLTGGKATGSTIADMLKTALRRSIEGCRVVSLMMMEWLLLWLRLQNSGTKSQRVKGMTLINLNPRRMAKVLYAGLWNQTKLEKSLVPLQW